MGRFYRNRPYRGFGAGFNPMNPLVGPEPGAAPVAPGAAAPMPEPLPTGLIEPAAPAGWPAYKIRPEFFQALPQKQIVPPLADQQTLDSLARNKWAAPVDVNPGPPPRVDPGVGAPAPVVPFFMTKASVAIQKATASDARAVRSSRLSVERTAKAAQAAYDAKRAAAAAAVDPASPVKQGELQAAADRAQKADELAAQAARAAALDRRKADAAAAEADAAARAQTEAEQALVDAGQGNGWSAPLPEAYAVPDYGVAGSSPSFLLPVGGGAVAGFLAAGPLGALVGAVLGGGYAYARQQGGPVTTTVGPAGAVPVTPAFDPNDPNSWIIR